MVGIARKPGVRNTQCVCEGNITTCQLTVSVPTKNIKHEKKFKIPFWSDCQILIYYIKYLIKNVNFNIKIKFGFNLEREKIGSC